MGEIVLLGEASELRDFPEPKLVARSAAAWVRAAVGGPDVSVRVSLPDPAGRLRVAAWSGTRSEEGRLRSARRRQAFTERRPLRFPVRQPAGRALEVHPMLAEDEPVGVVEVLAPASRLSDRSDALVGAIEQSSLLLRASTDRVELYRAMNAMRSLFHLTARLIAAETPLEALRAAVDLCHEHLGVPVAGVRPERGGAGWYLAAVAGLGKRRRATLRAAMRDVSAAGNGATLHVLSAGFADTVGFAEVQAVPVGDVVLLVAGRSRARAEFLATVQALLREEMAHAGDMRLVRSRNDGLDLGIAWTAHELRGPLLGAHAALGHVLVSDANGRSADLLRKTRSELERLAQLVDPLLRWSAGDGALRLRRTDLSRVAGRAVDACRLEAGEDRIDLVVEGPIAVRADAQQLEGALMNVIRNAVAYSPNGAPVRVSVASADGVAKVCVRDKGPGIPPEERDLIFDPFARGRAGARVGGGEGLGLFVSRRIVEAHGGRLGLTPSRSGAAFCLELPVAEGGSPSAR